MPSNPTHNPTRRDLLKLGAASLALAGPPRACLAREGEAPTGSEEYEICAFEKFIQDLSYDELSDALAELGFDGVEATVRRGGHVPPERVGTELPKLAAALERNGLKVTVMTTDVRDASDPLAREVLRVAADLGIERYRMGHFRYAKDEPVLEQLQRLRPAFAGLADLNRRLGLQGLYQNHSGWRYVGATLWDAHRLIDGIDPAELGAAFDIRHATVEAGLSWPLLYELMRPHIGAVYVKDFRWNGRKAENAPLGARVDPEFFKMLRADDYRGPISLHVEYLPDGDTRANLEALRVDLRTLRGWLQA
ncbi:sugar phosphate isomerase/epimerase family protein [Botrimarina sp.]|uniref:sugar phosphate isomerase/epimerase family protein n=1 Tax=Botrimarina sp. TaxID=2795802 RepID=UPI0032EE27D7